MKESQVQRLFNYLLTGSRIACKDAYNMLEIPDLRSRISNVEKHYGVTVQRERVKGKRYNEYFFNPIPKF